jgi:hypothetical protein
MKKSSRSPEEKTQETKDTQPTILRDSSFALNEPAISDAQGLERVYEAPGRTYTYGDTIFIARTRAPPLLSSDWMRNYRYLRARWLKCDPVETYMTNKCKDAERAREAKPYANKAVGHSLGGSVAIKMQKERGSHQ